MLNIILPRTKYDLTTYPNMEERAVGMSIPYCAGVVKNITPVIVDQGGYVNKICSNPLTSIDAVRGDDETLVEGVDYTTDLANGEFTFDVGSPLLAGNTTYYMIWNADYAISDINYIWVVGRDWSNYADGTLYFINGADAWSDQAVDATFKIYGRKVPSGNEELLVDNSFPGGGVQNNTLRYTAATTKIAQSFKLPAGDSYYVTRIEWVTRKITAPVGDVWIEIHSDQAGTQVGASAPEVDVSTLWDAATWQAPMIWAVKNIEDVKVDVTGEFSKIDDILNDILQNELGVAAGDIDAVALAALGVAKTQDLRIYQDKEKTFGQIVEKLEAGQLWKFIPKLDGTYTFVFYAAGAEDLALEDENFLSFDSYRDLSSVRQRVKVKYKEDASEQTWQISEDTSDVAKYVYKNEEMIEVETFLVDSADADALVVIYLTLLEYPARIIEFEIQGLGFDLIPTDKVKITRERGDNTDGIFDGVLFRILEITKKSANEVTRIKAQLDIQTYV